MLGDVSQIVSTELGEHTWPTINTPRSRINQGKLWVMWLMACFYTTVNSHTAVVNDFVTCALRCDNLT